LLGLCLHILQFEDTREKLDDTSSSIISAINSRCQCSLTVNHISTAKFLCISDRKVVLYRAVLSGLPDCSQVLSYIQQWINGDQVYIFVQGNRMEVYPNCPTEVDSLTAQAHCLIATPTPTPTPTQAPIFGPAIGGGVGGVVLIGIIIVAIAVCIYRHNKQR